MMALVRSMRQAILTGSFVDFVREFVNDQFRGKSNGGQDVPKWVKDALEETGINF
jgi:hypothetical protein